MLPQKEVGLGHFNTKQALCGCDWPHTRYWVVSILFLCWKEGIKMIMLTAKWGIVKMRTFARFWILLWKFPSHRCTHNCTNTTKMERMKGQHLKAVHLAFTYLKWRCCTAENDFYVLSLYLQYYQGNLIPTQRGKSKGKRITPLLFHF